MTAAAPAGIPTPSRVLTREELEPILRAWLDDQKKRAIPITPEEETVVGARLLKSARALGWEHPFFLPMIGECQFRLGRALDTAWVTEDGIVTFNPAFVETLDDAELQGLIAHELCHLLMLHHLRRGERDPARWFKAADRAINAILWDARLYLPQCAAAKSRKTPYCTAKEPCGKCGIYPTAAQWAWAAEQLYEEEEQGGANLQIIIAVGAGCGVMPSETPPPPGMSPEQAAADQLRHWQEVRAMCENQARTYGDTAGDTLARLLELPTPRVQWPSILRKAASDSVAAHGRDANTWTRRSRRSGVEGPQWPGWQALRCRVATIVDVSGSMTDEDVTEAVANICAIAAHSAAKFYLVVHDHKVQWQGWVLPQDKPETICAKVFVGRGGTSFEEAYAAVGMVKTKFDACIHLTDGEVGQWPHRPANTKKLIVALLGSKQRRGTPADALVIDATIRGGDWA